MNRHPPVIRSLGRRGALLTLPLVLSVSFAEGAQARQPVLPVSTATKALTGLKYGSVAGGVLGGLALGVLASGLCDAADCSGSFGEGVVVGALGGAVVGGLVGLVGGSAFVGAAGQRRWPGARSWALSGGSRWAGESELRGQALRLSLTTLRPTTRRVSFGFQAGWLGSHEGATSYTITRRDGTSTRHDERWRRTVWHAGLIATRALGDRPPHGPYVAATMSVYPVREAVDFTQSGLPDEPTEGSDRSLWPHPGVGLGAGQSWSLGRSLTVGLESRLDVLLGAGGEGWLPMLSIGATMGLGATVAAGIA